jgi:hypothetical protein
MKVVVEPLEALEPLPLEPLEPLRVAHAAGDDPGEALIKEAKQRARRRRLIYAGVAMVVVAVAATAVSSWSNNTAPARHATPPVPPPPAVPLGAPLVVGPDASSTLLASWGQMHTGYVFVYADGRVIWEPEAPVYADADGRVTVIPLGGPTAEVGRFWLTESGLEPASGKPKGEFVSRNIERRLSARGLDLLRAGKIDVKHLLVLPDEQWPAELPRRPEDLQRWPVAIQLWLRPELWAGSTARIWQPSTWAIGFRWQYLHAGEDTHPVKQVDAARVLEQLPASAQAVLTGKRRACNYTNAGNAHWLFESTVGLVPGPEVCFELDAAELAALNRSVTRNTFEVDGRSAGLNALPIYPHGQPQVWGG